MPTHRWVGANTLMSKYYGYDQQLEKTIAFLRNKVLNVDIFGIERNGQQLSLRSAMRAFTVAPGDALRSSVVIQNKGARSHSCSGTA